MSDNEQRSYLMNLIHLVPIQRRRNGNYTNAENSRRQTSVTFTLSDGVGCFKRVCKQTFLETFNVSPSKITTPIKRLKSGLYMFTDKRGGCKTFKYTHHDRCVVREHVNCFPSDVSHYCRPKHNNDIEYLSSDLNINRMYAAFKKEHPNTLISKRFYYRVFRKDYPNVKFRRPRVDSCKTCDLLHMKQSSSSNKAEACKAKMDLDAHHRVIEKARKEVANDCLQSTLPGGEACVLTIDLQKVFPLPKLTHSKMYYNR